MDDNDDLRITMMIMAVSPALHPLLRADVDLGNGVDYNDGHDVGDDEDDDGVTCAPSALFNCFDSITMVVMMMLVMVRMIMLLPSLHPLLAIIPLLRKVLLHILQRGKREHQLWHRKHCINMTSTRGE